MKEYVEEQGLKMEAEHFYDHFSSNGWKVSGRATMKDWQAAVQCRRCVQGLDLKNPRQTLKDNVDPEDLRITETLTSGGKQMVNVDDVDLTKCETKMNGKLRTVNFVNESGLYSLILSSKMPNVQAFKRWGRHAPPAGEERHKQRMQRDLQSGGTTQEA